MIDPKETQKQCLIKVIQTTMRAQTQELSLCVCLCAYPHVLYAFPVNKCFTCFTTFCLYGNSFLPSLRSRPLSLTTDLVAKIQLSHHHDLMLNLWLGAKALLQAVVGRGHLRSLWVYFNIFITFWSKCVICKNNRGVVPCRYSAKCTYLEIM